jgi:hypothetical protein
MFEVLEKDAQNSRLLVQGYASTGALVYWTNLPPSRNMHIEAIFGPLYSSGFLSISLSF